MHLILLVPLGFLATIFDTDFGAGVDASAAAGTTGFIKFNIIYV